MAALGQCRGGGQAGRSSSDDRDLLALGRGGDDQVTLVAGARVHQAGHGLALEDVVQAGLIARDARVDPVGLSCLRLADEHGVGQQGPGHADHVGGPVGQDLLAHLRGVDPVGGHQWDVDPLGAQLVTHLVGDPGEGRPRHTRGDRGDPCLVPSDAGVDDRRARLGDRLGQLHDLRPRAAVRDQVEHGQPIDQDEVRADGLARAPHDLHGQAHPVLVGPAPLVVALVRVGDEELVDEVPLRAHDLDSVVPGFLRQLGTPHEGLDLALHATASEGPRRERRDGAAQAGGRHRQG